MSLYVAPSASGEGSPPAPAAETAPVQAELVSGQYKQTTYHQRRTDYWSHLRSAHYPLAHVKLKRTSSLAYEQYRTRVWAKREQDQQRRYIEWRVAMQGCRRAGFPSAYCPTLLEVTTALRVRGWSRDPNLAFVIRHESGFNPRADNPHSTAYGLFQMLTETSTNPKVQTQHGLMYIKGRYGTPAGAASFWRAHSWY